MMNVLSKTTGWRWGAFALFFLTLFCVNSLQAHTPQRPTGEIVGRVTSGTSKTPEAGVWVIAEAPEGLPTAYRKIVVTDDNGYFVIPELPYLDYPDHSDEDGTGHEGDHGGIDGDGHGLGHEKRYPYHVWVRGYDVEDSDPIETQLTHDVHPAAFNKGALRISVHRYDLNNRTEAFANAQNYPANYWWSLYEPPVLAPSYIPQKILEADRHNDCWYCHQIGGLYTRQVATFEEYNAILSNPPHTGVATNTWDILHPGERSTIINSFAAWSSKITNDKMIPEDKYPENRPNRPTGIERNVVISQWDWAKNTPPNPGPFDRVFVHDNISTDKRNPSSVLYRNGKVWGANIYTGTVEALDPNTHEIFTYKPDFPPPRSLPFPPYYAPSWADFHNLMLDDTGKLWLTAKVMWTFSPEEWPGYCSSTGNNIHGDYLNTWPYIDTLGNRQLAYFDPDQKTFHPIMTCYNTHHLQFDPNGVIWTSGDWRVGGTFFDPSKYDPNDPSTLPQAQGFTPKHLAYLSENQPKPPEDPVFESDFGYNYGIIPNPNDTTDEGEQILSIWTAPIKEAWAGIPLTSGLIQRFIPYEVKRKGNGDLILDKNGLPILTEPSSAPTGYGKFETYFPFITDDTGTPLPGTSYLGHHPRGIDVTSDGRIFTAYNNTGYLAEFDPNKPGVDIKTGAAPGWRTWEIPGPRVSLYADTEDFPLPTANSHYYTWIDQFSTLGIKDNYDNYIKDIVVVNGTNSDSLFVFDSTKGKEGFIAEIRMPYPKHFFNRGLDGRIDDPDAGWKGRGWWVSNNTDTADWFIETGRVNINKIQLRDTPLDR